MELITSAQIKKLWTMAKQLNLTSEAMHQIVMELTGVESVKAMSKAAANHLIDIFDGHISGKYGSDIATNKQLFAIESYRAELGWDSEHLRSFISRTSGVHHIQWLDRKAASKVITGLSKTLEHQRKKVVAQ